MNYTYLSVIGSLIGTIAIVLISLYLYVLYRKRYMGIWAIGWLILVIRHAIMDTGYLPWKQSFLGLTFYLLLTFIYVLLIVWSTYSFINKPLNKFWLYGAAGSFVISTALNLLPLPLTYKLLLPIYVCCIAGIWIGLTFLRNQELPIFSRLITGYAYLLISLINFSAPFIIPGSWVLPWGYALGGILRLTVAIGTLMLYFEKTRNALSAKELQYRHLAENAIDVIYYYRLLPPATLEYVSPSALAVTGYTPTEYYANNRLIFTIIHPEDKTLLGDFIANLPHTLSTPLTLRLLCKDKNTLWVEHKCLPIYDKTGHLIAVEGIIRDVSQRKKLEQMASTFDRMNMVGSMAATVAHEIRNPMTTVRGYLQFLERKEKYQTEKENFRLMIEEIDRANTIIREYLALSREKFVSLEPCSLNHIIETLFPLIQADATSSKVSASLTLENIPDLPLDKNEIRQLLLNLVRNGIEAMPTGGKLTIRTFLDENKAVLSVSDQGSGIPPDMLEQLGTPFFTTKENGTGLGLPICYQIAHRHNASIKIDTSVQGTTFFVYFNHPLQSMPPEL
ncbi:MAG: sasA 14 [Firmicutes bacterium]|nr:sasA 14 [Bacillota bacterium]